MNLQQKLFPTAILSVLMSTMLSLSGQEPLTPNYYQPAKVRKPSEIECEVAVYGGTPAGVAAAIEAARMGRKTLLLSFHRHVGGMTSGGLTATDLGKQESIGGLALDFYTLDSHFCQRVVVEESGKTTVRNEGGFGHGFPKPYPVSYRAIVPKEQECTNLLVPVCLSASHVAYGSIRMEPVSMILGQSAGAAASLAITDKVPVQGVDYGKLKERLLEGKQRL